MGNEELSNHENGKASISNDQNNLVQENLPKPDFKLNLDPSERQTFETPQPAKRLNPVENFLKSRQDYKVDPKRAETYLQLDRYIDVHNANYQIPLGAKDSMQYKGEPTGVTADRGIDEYQFKLFSNSEEEMDEFIGDGKAVLDLGSGRAIGIMEMSQKHPKSTFIGVDALYQEERKVFPDKKGLQLTWGDWGLLTNINDNTIDTIISVEGILQWGVPGIGGRHGDEYTSDAWNSILDNYHRVLKDNGRIRVSIASVQNNRDRLLEDIDPEKWDYTVQENLLTITKK